MSREQSYAEKHDIAQIRLGEMFDQVMVGYRLKMPLAFVGPAGIGKTSIISQACKALTAETGVKVENRVFMLSQKVPEDLSGIPFPELDVASGEQVVKMLRLDELPRNGHGILFFDEMNQADQNVLRSVFQILSDRRIGSYTLPDGYSMVACMNPDDENYGTSTPSPALRRRLSWIELRFDPVAFFEYAKQQNWDETLVNFLRNNRDMILNEAALANGKVFACPASWESVNTLIQGMRATDKISTIRAIASGFVGMTFFNKFMTYFERHGVKLEPADVLEKYAQDGKLQDRVKKILDKGKTDIIAQTCCGLVTFMLQINPLQDQDFLVKARNLAKFFVDINGDAAVSFLKDIRKNFEEQNRNQEKALWLQEFASFPEGQDKLIALMKTVNNIAEEVAQAGV